MEYRVQGSVRRVWVELPGPLLDAFKGAAECEGLTPMEAMEEALLEWMGRLAVGYAGLGPIAGNLPKPV